MSEGKPAPVTFGAPMPPDPARLAELTAEALSAGWLTNGGTLHMRLEQALAVVLETMVEAGRMDWPTLVERMSSTPARIGQVEGQGQALVPGSVANLVLVDPSARAVVSKDSSASRSRNNPYHGRELPDPVVLTMWKGRVTHQR